MSSISYLEESNTIPKGYKEDISALLKQDFSNKKVLLYAREPKLSGLLFRQYGNTIAKKYLKVDKYDILADMDGPRDFVLEVDKYNYADYTVEDYKIFREILDIESIIRNDRVFRHSIPYYDACEMIYSCTKFMIEFFKKHHYDIVLTNMMDFYVTEIVVLVAQYFKIPVISYCANPFGLDYIKITKRGESTYVREPKEEEIEALYQKLNTKRNPYVKSKSKVYQEVLLNYAKHKVKYVYHHLIQNRLLGSKQYVHLTANSGTYPRDVRALVTHEKYFLKDISQLKLDPTKTVYIPLHYYPESTTDYWIHKEEYTTYYPSLFETVKSYSERGFNVLLKEHTAMYFQRHEDLYKRLNQISNVYLISPFITTYQMFDLADYIVVWTGTTGIEAIMNDKKVVLAWGETYYSYGKLPHIGNEDQAKVFTQFEKKQLLKKILSCYLPL